MVSLSRRSLLAAGALAAAACASNDAPAPQAAAKLALVSPWLTITGAWLTDLQPLPGAPTPVRTRINFIQPVGIAVQGDVLLVADAAARAIWRMERSRDTAARFAPLQFPATPAGVSMQLDPDFTAWVAQPAEHAVAQYDLRGRLVRLFRDDANVPRPVAVAVPRNRADVIVADGAALRLYRWDSAGRVVRAFGRAGLLQSVAAMTIGPQGVYVLDRLAQHVLVLDAEGEPVQTLGERQLVQPRALAVDASGRVFVSDDQSQQVKVFRGSRLLAAVGADPAGPRFGRIESLAVDGNLLYVADSLNARIHVLLVGPPSIEPELGP